MTDRTALIAALIQTEALVVSPPAEVFWYTSGTVGPYYINTHYLFGGRQPAQELLSFIDASKGDEDFPARLEERCQRAYDSSAPYRLTIDALAQDAAEAAPDATVVSGGERRDWFFSAAVARVLGLPHLLLRKDGAARIWDHGPGPAADDLTGVRALHVADLVTEASSYTRAWIPAVRTRGGAMTAACNVIDRAQGGIDAIAAAGVPARALLRVDEDLFGALLDQGAIDEAQRDGLVAYFRDPHGAMRAFLQEHPDFLKRSLASPEQRTADRARLLVERDLYGLG